MSVYLFTALFYLLLFLTIGGTLLCGHVCAITSPKQSPPENTFELLKIKKGGETMSGVFEPTVKSQANQITVKEYYSPFLMATKDVMIAMAGTNYTEGSDENIGILTRYIKIGNGWGEKAVKGSDSDWITQLAVQNKIKKNKQ